MNAPPPTGVLAMLALGSGMMGCATRPNPTPLPTLAAVDTRLAEAPADELPVAELEHDGIRGGQIAAAMPADADDVLAMLLDFEGADGHRAWAEHYELVAREPSGVVARWSFSGKLGVHPTTELRFVVARVDGETEVAFEQLEPVFGLGAFFGDYRIVPLPPLAEPAAGAASRGRALLVMRVFIDSGLPFVNASAEDIAAGLREDVRLMRDWLRERPPAGLPFPPTAPVAGEPNGP